VRLLFDVRDSSSLTTDQRDRIEERLATRITKGHVRVPTKVPKTQRKRRLESKRLRSQKKAMRSRPGEED